MSDSYDPTQPNFYIGTGAAAPLAAPAASAPVPAASAAYDPTQPGYYIPAPSATSQAVGSALPYLGPGLGAATAYAQHRAVIPSKVRNVAKAARDLAPQVQAAQEQELAATRLLQQARAAHEALASPDAVNAFRATLPQTPGPVLTPEPVGGTGTYKYTIPAGGTHVQALEAPDYRTVQQEVIPKNVEAQATINRIAPGARKVKESSLWLTPSGEQDVGADVSAAKQTLQEQQALAARRLTAAQSISDAASRRAAQLAASQDALNSQLLARTAELSPVQRRAAEALGSDATKYLPDVIRGAGGLLSRIAVPLTVAAVPGQASEAWRAAKEGDWQHAITSGLGALGGTAVGAGAGLAALGLAPEIATGLGAAGLAAGLAPLGQSAYDWYQQHFGSSASPSTPQQSQ